MVKMPGFHSTSQARSGCSNDLATGAGKDVRNTWGRICGAFWTLKAYLADVGHRVTLDNFWDFRAPNFEAPESDWDPCVLLWDEASFEATRTWDVPVPSEKPKRPSAFEAPEM